MIPCAFGRARAVTRRAAITAALTLVAAVPAVAQPASNPLFQRGAGPLAPAFWRDLAEAAPAEWHAIAEFVAQWEAYARANSGPAAALAAAAFLAALGGAGWHALRWCRRLVSRPAPQRFDQALAALLVVLADTTIVPALILSAVLVLRDFGLMPGPATALGADLATALAIAGFGSGVATGLFAPGDPGRRMVAFTDREAASYASHFAWAARTFGLAVFLNSVHGALQASGTAGAPSTPLAPSLAIGALFALVIAAITVHLLWRSAQADFRAGTVASANGGFAWFRAVLWLFAGAVLAGLAAGYVGFAMFVAGRVVASLAVVGMAIIAMVFIDTLMTEPMAPDRPAGRRIATLLGLGPHGLELIETLASALLRLAIMVLAALFILGYTGLITGDVYGLFERASAAFTFGGITVSAGAIVTSVVLVTAGGLAIRGAQRWLAAKFLPRSGLDAGLQNSILSLFGYAGAMAVLALALAALGIDLQKIALIAGALSVGIGFGLQSVVSNFVCGLILLAERSIRVGDWVVVKNEEGWVRRISVRATEIETFDRARVLIPNQEFITGVVKNWTHGGTVGRVIVKVRVTYDSSLDQVRETLMECGLRHPLVLHAPPPSVFLIGFGDIGIDFELRCLIGVVEQALAIRSELQMEVMRRFGEAGIKMPFPGHEERPPGPVAAPARPPTA